MDIDRTEKAYCEKCRWFLDNKNEEFCLSPNNLKDTYRREKTVSILDPKDRNASNRCLDFEKSISFWEFLKLVWKNKIKKKTTKDYETATWSIQNATLTYNDAPEVENKNNTIPSLETQNEIEKILNIENKDVYPTGEVK